MTDLRVSLSVGLGVCRHPGAATWHHPVPVDDLEATGRSYSHLAPLEGSRFWLHRDALEPFRALQAAAAADGIELTVLSAHRSLAHQVAIWNEKMSGERRLYDRTGRLLHAAALDAPDLIGVILAWSALPGASRHHWGTDLDVYDRAALPEGERFDLVTATYERAGRFERLGSWLDDNLSRFGFFRPYDLDRGGVAPEPWHISYGPTSEPALSALTVELLATALADVDLLGKSFVLAELPAILERYVLNVGRPG